MKMLKLKLLRICHCVAEVKAWLCGQFSWRRSWPRCVCFSVITLATAYCRLKFVNVLELSAKHSYLQILRELTQHKLHISISAGPPTPNQSERVERGKGCRFAVTTPAHEHYNDTPSHLRQRHTYIDRGVGAPLTIFHAAKEASASSRGADGAPTAENNQEDPPTTGALLCLHNRSGPVHHPCGWYGVLSRSHIWMG